MKKYISILVVVLLALSSCTDFLTRDPKDTVTDTQSFWNSEDNIRTSLYSFYTDYFPGYRSDWSRADWYSETNVADWTDDNAQEAATFFTKVAPATDNDNWSFTNVRALNTIINRVGASTLSDEAKNHWLGVARFFRAMEYSNLVSKFGDVPWYSNALGNADYDALYKARDSRTLVMDNVLNDFQFACKYVRSSDGKAGLSVNKDVVYAFMSRCMLFEGTWQKYRANSADYAAKYLQAAKDAAQFIMNEGKYKLCDDYKALTTSLDLANNPEIIIYRSYVSGIVTHSLMSFQNTEIEINSPSKSLVDSYLTMNGLPVTQDASYKGDKWYSDEMANRDPRLGKILDADSLRLKGVVGVYATSGYFGTRFVNPSILNVADGRSNTCVTDAPVMKYNEVLMNYIEAAVELSQLGKYTLTQADFDKTINVIRDRKSTSMPHLVLSGSNLLVNGIIINDTERDADVPSIVWEVRRERRTELVYEGIRFNDLRRWNKLYYADMVKNPKLNCGAWLDKDKYVAWYNANHKSQISLETLKSITLDRTGNAGYIKPITNSSLLRICADKDYLYPIPVNQISLYEAKGYKLSQNPGW